MKTLRLTKHGFFHVDDENSGKINNRNLLSRKKYLRTEMTFTIVCGVFFHDYKNIKKTNFDLYFELPL